MGLDLFRWHRPWYRSQLLSVRGGTRAHWVSLPFVCLYVDPAMIGLAIIRKKEEEQRSTMIAIDWGVYVCCMMCSVCDLRWCTWCVLWYVGPYAGVLDAESPKSKSAKKHTKTLVLLPKFTRIPNDKNLVLFQTMLTGGSCASGIRFSLMAPCTGRVTIAQIS